MTLEIPRPEPGLPPHSVLGRVVWVQRPRTVRELFQIGLEFEVPGNVWGIAFPPDDWAASIAETNSEASVASEIIRELEIAPSAPHAAPPATYARGDAAPVEPVAAPPPIPVVSAAPAKPAAPVTHVAPPAAAAPTVAVPAAPVAAPASPASASAAPVDNKIHVVTTPQPDPQVAIAKHMAKMVTEAKENLDKSLRKGAETAIAEEMTIVRQQLDVQLHDAVEKAIKVSMERVSSRR